MSLVLALLTAISVPLAADGTPTPIPVAQPAPTRCGYRIVHSYPHDPRSFTQGLLWHDGHLYESTGQYRHSRIVRLDLETGKTLAEASLPADEFGEGIARWGDQIVSVTWKSGIGHRWRIGDLRPLGTFTYEGEGWGLTTHSDNIVLSDGTANLRFFDPTTMTETKRVPVTLAGHPLRMLNELEEIDGEIWANVWMTDAIVRIDTDTGIVHSIVDLSGLKAAAGAGGHDSVLNGIAWDAKGKRLFVTGKYWPTLYEIALADCH